MKQYCIENLLELRRLISLFDEEKYQSKLQILSNSSIGQHLRHVLEFYRCIIKGASDGSVNYDNRERDLNLEQSPELAISFIDQICDDIPHLNGTQEILLGANFSHNGEVLDMIKSSIERELVYCLEHSIHHQALIKIGLIDQKMDHLIDQSFGIAPSTIRHQQSCAQ